MNVGSLRHDEPPARSVVNLKPLERVYEHFVLGLRAEVTTRPKAPCPREPTGPILPYVCRCEKGMWLAYSEADPFLTPDLVPALRSSLVKSRGN